MGNLLRVSKVDESGLLPIRQATLYKWHHQGRHPEIFLAIGKRNLFVDLDKFNEVMNRKSGSAKDLCAA